MQKKMNRVGEIWKDLSAIDVNAYTYKKNGLDYLPWARAVGILMDRYPDMEYRFIEFEDSSGNKQFLNSVPAGDGTFTGIVAVEVCVEGISKKMSRDSFLRSIGLQDRPGSIRAIEAWEKYSKE